ncbi:tetraacyldisaccharide 4'-kinase [Aliiglaciecola litoralis]|uniref:Tetraacyldisaccharide 4'-kinase n=1 Tax=Aliiglaciecola litoralis TaxID=582857 RepID=A0ABN1LCM7_9ALTE
MTLIEKVWYQPTPTFIILKWLLFPLMWVFWCLSSIRRIGYRNGWLKSWRVDVPVIIVGNISVGGNGKTPLVVYLANWLVEQGYKPGILSRGYGGKSSFYPAGVDSQSDVAKVGDEPILIKQRVSCPVVVDPKRTRGAKYLKDKYQCNIILCDDGLQHYALQRDIEIVVVDGSRRYGNRWLLPMGPLRESEGRVKSVDFVVNNGGPAGKDEVLMEIEPDDLINVKNVNQSMPLSDLSEATAVAAIGNPERFFSLLDHHNVTLKQRLSFIDHYQFKAQDIPDGTVVMTEKDAVKCRAIAHEDWWFLPIRATLPDTFLMALKQRLDTLNKEKE